MGPPRPRRRSVLRHTQAVAQEGPAPSQVARVEDLCDLADHPDREVQVERTGRLQLRQARPIELKKERLAALVDLLAAEDKLDSLHVLDPFVHGGDVVEDPVHVAEHGRALHRTDDVEVGVSLEDFAVSHQESEHRVVSSGEPHGVGRVVLGHVEDALE